MRTMLLLVGAAALVVAGCSPSGGGRRSSKDDGDGTGTSGNPTTTGDTGGTTGTGETGGTTGTGDTGGTTGTGTGDGACANGADQEIMNSPSFGEAYACAVECPKDAKCAATCLTSQTGISAGCADCFGEVFVCTFEFCLELCTAGANTGCEA